MVVYVDDMYRYPMGQFRRMKMSHMIATTDAELHQMARHIGIARRHFQKGDHYDVCMSYRKKAVSAGAVEITMRQLSAIRMCWRWNWKFKSPEHAYELVVGKHRDHPKASNKARKSKEVSVSRTRNGRHWQIRLC